MKYNKKEIMTRAWTFARNAKISISEALKRSWKIAKMQSAGVKMQAVSVNQIKKATASKSIAVKSWFLNKNFSQNERHVINISDLTIEMETKKAVFIQAYSKFGMLKFWCPKSCLI